MFIKSIVYFGSPGGFSDDSNSLAVCHQCFQGVALECCSLVRMHFVFHPQASPRGADVKHVGEAVGKPICQLFDERGVGVLL